MSEGLLSLLQNEMQLNPTWQQINMAGFD